VHLADNDPVREKALKEANGQRSDPLLLTDIVTIAPVIVDPTVKISYNPYLRIDMYICMYVCTSY
jgi:hypothetical protein